MKVFYFITKSNWGGAQQYVFDLACASKKAGFFSMVYAGGSGRLFDALQKEGISTGKLRASERDINLGKDINLFFEIFEILKNEKPDVIHVNSSKIGGLGALAGRIAGVPKIIFTAHGWPFKEDVFFVKRWAMWFLSWLTAMLSHKVIVPSRDDLMKGVSMTFVSNKMTYIPHGREIHGVLKKEEARRFLQSLLPIPTDKLWFGINAELHPNKGYKYLLESFVDIDAYLVCMSDGEEREVLLKQVKELGIKDKVFFLGFVPDGARYMSAFDIFILSSLKEGLPYVLLEAASLGLPTIATRVGGAPEIIGDAGMLIPSKNSRELHDAMKEMMEDETKRTSFGIALRERSEKIYSFEEMVKKTIDLYKD